MGRSNTEVSSSLSMAGLLSWYFYDLRRALVSQQEDWWRQADQKKDPPKDGQVLFDGFWLFGGRWKCVA